MDHGGVAQVRLAHPVVGEGRAADLLTDEQVRQAYLGYETTSAQAEAST